MNPTPIKKLPIHLRKGQSKKGHAKKLERRKAEIAFGICSLKIFRIYKDMVT
jgi:hypothetical protein